MAGDEAIYFAYYNTLKKIFEITSKLGEDGLISPLSLAPPPSLPQNIPNKKSSTSPDRSPVGSPMLNLTIPTSTSRPPTHSPRSPNKKKGMFEKIKGVVKGQRKNSTDKEIENE